MWLLPATSFFGGAAAAGLAARACLKLIGLLLVILEVQLIVGVRESTAFFGGRSAAGVGAGTTGAGQGRPCCHGCQQPSWVGHRHQQLRHFQSDGKDQV